jgi:hypothetical protein
MSTMNRDRSSKSLLHSVTTRESGAVPTRRHRHPPGVGKRDFDVQLVLPRDDRFSAVRYHGVATSHPEVNLTLREKCPGASDPLCNRA